MKNRHVEASLDIFEKIEGVPLFRVNQVRSYIEALEEDNVELLDFVDKLNVVFREFNAGEME